MVIKAESDNPKRAKNVLQEITKIILREHQEKIKFERENINRKIEQTQTEINLYKDNISRIENKIAFAKREKKNLQAQVNALEKTLIYNQTPGTQFALFNIKEKLENKNKEIENLYAQLTSCKIHLENLNFTIKSLKYNRKKI